MAGPVAVVGCGLTEVVDPSPDELTHTPAVVVLADEVVLGEVAPPAVLDIVARGLVVGVLSHGLAYDGELIHPS